MANQLNGVEIIQTDIVSVEGKVDTVISTNALASVLGALNDAVAAGVVTDVDTAIAYLKQLVTAELAAVTERSTILAEVQETERHLHNLERWIGPAAAPSGEDHIADNLGGVAVAPLGVQTSFQLTSGLNKDWGTAVQIWGATDCTLLPVGRQAFFDPHRIRFTDVEQDKKEWLICVIYGSSAAAGISAGTYTMHPFFIEKTDKNDADIELYFDHVPAGTKVWVQILNITANDAWYLDIQFGVHGYPA